MNRPRQFSLAYLFLEIFWIALALGLAMQAFRLPPSLDVDLYQKLLLGPAVMFAGTAIGGLFGRMTAGFLITFALFALVVFGMLAFMVILVVGGIVQTFYG